MDSMTQKAKMLAFAVSDDGYPDNTAAAVASILAAAAAHGVTHLTYNLEQPTTWDAKLARLAAVKAELDRQGNALPFIFGPIYTDFLRYFASAAPYCDGYAIQLQNAPVGEEGTLAADAVAKAESVMADPIMVIQVSCLSTNRTVLKSLNRSRRWQGLARHSLPCGSGMQPSGRSVVRCWMF